MVVRLEAWNLVRSIGELDRRVEILSCKGSNRWPPLLDHMWSVLNAGWMLLPPCLPVRRRWLNMHRYRHIDPRLFTPSVSELGTQSYWQPIDGSNILVGSLPNNRSWPTCSLRLKSFSLLQKSKWMLMPGNRMCAVFGEGPTRGYHLAPSLPIG